MASVKRPTPKKKEKPVGRGGKPLSLYGVSLKDALRVALSTPLPPEEAPKKAAKAKKAGKKRP
jgi:hypothetical protein